MITTVTDDQTIGETEAQAFQMVQQGPVAAAVTLTNAGTNVIVYRFQQNVSGTWTDIQTYGNPLNGTLVAGQVLQALVASAYPMVRVLAAASGGSLLQFTATRWYARASGGQIPILGF